jgi:large subunit ribosomal protein L32
MTIRMRHTKAHTKNRRSHHKVAENAITTDAKTGSVHLRHRASADTGLYRGRQVLDVAAKAEKKAAKNK